jgi:hypothetical protein
MADIVTAPLVIAKRADGSDVYLYEGVEFPEGMAEGEAERLAEFLSEDDAEGKSDKPAVKSAASKSSK